MTQRLVLTAFALFSTALLAFAAPEPEVGPVATSMPPEKLEPILDKLEIKYKKTAGKKDGIYFYDFRRGGLSVRLHNYDGQDLWIDSTFTEPLALEDVNKWNVRAKFSRAVLIPGDEKVTVSLEAQLDCVGGVTDAMVRQFIRRFDGELAQFSAYAKK
jgi:hypothetical protein